MLGKAIKYSVKHNKTQIIALWKMYWDSTTQSIWDCKKLNVHFQYVRNQWYRGLRALADSNGFGGKVLYETKTAYNYAYLCKNVDGCIEMHIITSERNYIVPTILNEQKTNIDK